ncbi:MAG TPA: hypothetical protein VGO43_15630 [Pyrinomonadaceae bacterium]|jgi:hypothetical protein|nr:hypothetical protein [Pyrinomonadaceae bacterium]
MQRSTLLTVSSLLSILLLTLHISDDIVLGMDTPGPGTLIGIGIAVVLLYGTLVLWQRLAGRIIILLTGLAALGMPIIHLRGTHIIEIVRSSGGLFFMWTLFALGVLGTFTVILAVQEMLDRRKGD